MRFLSCVEFFCAMSRACESLNSPFAKGNRDAERASFKTELSSLFTSVWYFSWASSVSSWIRITWKCSAASNICIDILSRFFLPSESQYTPLILPSSMMIVFGSIILFITGDERWVRGSLGGSTLGSILPAKQNAKVGKSKLVVINQQKFTAARPALDDTI